ncbi:solute carrier family 15 member 4-like [Corticium candelabrum]|uniref:solute carrier family 15 member 4-like n=1 Tax=Corticium candelabrum TaxID=121492 RepID=UPI002E359533|nr:solute carrier family 15 member 4-like [Corticium candelabrum]
MCVTPQQQHFNIDLLRQYEREPGNEDERRRKKQEEDTKRLANLVPFMAAVIVYFMIDSQTESSFVSQGLKMDYSDLFNETILPEDWTYSFDPLGVIVTVPVMLFIIKPLYEHIAGRTMTVLPRIRWGMIMAALACGLASLVESIRLSCCGFKKTIRHFNGNTFHYCHSGLPIYTQVPQYLIIGMSEVLATVGFMEFVLSTSPREFRCTTFGVLQMMQGIARYFGAFLLYIIEKSRPTWYYVRQKSPLRCSNGHDHESSPYYYYVILTWMMILNVIFYMIAEFRYKKYTRMAPLEIT